MDLPLLFNIVQATSLPGGEIEETYANAIWTCVPKWIEAIRKDLKQQFSQLFYAKRVEVYFSDPTYRQGATGLIFFLGSRQDQQFTLRLEILPDHNQYDLSVPRRPAKSHQRLEEVADKIDSLPANWPHTKTLY